ncbi:hypothetical protein FKP32DRAFT_1140535 [Trametes sanguinea]|nr:hypothetical protein FKP32DRAFT_1140535 [Trametes sanguinea]
MVNDEFRCGEARRRYARGTCVRGVPQHHNQCFLSCETVYPGSHLSVAWSPPAQDMSYNPYTNKPPMPSSPAPKASGKDDPLSGWRSRKVTTAQVLKAMQGDVNPFTKRPHSPQYKKILEARKKLPVFAQMEGFLKTFANDQIVIVVGETGSGKTTQIPQIVCYSDLPHTKGQIVACTQPWRVAAMLMAKRVADEMDVRITLNSSEYIVGRSNAYTLRNVGRPLCVR